MGVGESPTSTYRFARVATLSQQETGFSCETVATGFPPVRAPRTLAHMPGHKKAKVDCGVAVWRKMCPTCRKDCRRDRNPTACPECGKPLRYWCERKVRPGERCDTPGHDTLPRLDDLPANQQEVGSAFFEGTARAAYDLAWTAHVSELARHNVAWLHAKTVEMEASGRYDDSRIMDAKRSTLEACRRLAEITSLVGSGGDDDSRELVIQYVVDGAEGEDPAEGGAQGAAASTPNPGQPHKS